MWRPGREARVEDRDGELGFGRKGGEILDDRGGEKCRYRGFSGRGNIGEGSKFGAGGKVPKFDR